jgi:hypothetical protein
VTPDELQRNALNVIQLAIKASPAAQKVDANQVVFALAQQWNKVAPDTTQLILQPLYNVLRDKGVSPQDSAVVCLLVQRREDRLAVRVELPREVGSLPAQARVDMLANVPKMGSTGLTVVPAGARAPAPAVSAAGPRVAEPAPAAAPPAPAPAPRPAALPNLNRKFPVSPGVMLLSVVLLGITVVLRLASADKGLVPLKGELPAPLAAFKAFHQEEYVFFYDPQKDFDRTKEELDALGAQMSKVGEAHNAVRVFMCLAEDPRRCNKIKAVVRPGRVTYLLKPPPGAEPRTGPIKPGNPPPATP